MPGQGLAHHAWYHYAGAGPASLLGMVVPIVVLLLLMLLLSAASSSGSRASALLSRRKSRGAGPSAVSRQLHPERRELASDVERDQTARVVSHAVGEGRLSFDEGERRIDAVLRSRHRHELAGLVADLPHGTAQTTDRRPSTRLRLGLLMVAATMVLAAVVVQAVIGLWVLWPLAVVVLGASALLPRR